MDFFPTLSSQIHSIATMAIIVKAIVNLIFAGAVAHDGGLILKSGRKTQLVSPMTWAFATLLGGVIAAAIYWFIHHYPIPRKNA
ncbi:MAG: hypothetical protein ABIH77_04035 [Pseudomonadota bacterium]|nr:hypothetical protein [Gammaproteobacteria bacterium]MBU1629173.1 hypothetical protein [Gammaproteobacteria bacterium]MBU1926565.1 hypothetical protein [Gammaproteobacteria bacterium]MBU2546621.1 hypothetical protein [Gammaproteobacteria bacterium]